MILLDKLKSHFEQQYGKSPQIIVRSPGRVNLIGEHTDYNDGFVLPMTINRASWIALEPQDEPKVDVYSADFDEMLTFSLEQIKKSNSDWQEYIKGTAWALQKHGYKLKGWRGVVIGDVPIGAGLSSSAALELTVSRAFSAISTIQWDAIKMAKIAQDAENNWVGVNCGIMDQMISSAGKRHHALLIDCRSLDSELVPLPLEAAVIVMDTGTRRGLVDSAYNERRQQCETAARIMNVTSLRDATIEMLHAHKNNMDDVTFRRAKHVITENTRTLNAKNSLLKHDVTLLGKLINESHESLRSDFEVSNDALNVMVSIAQVRQECYGARMTGAGFGGCAVAIVEKTSANDFANSVAQEYHTQTGNSPQIYVCEATNGAEIIEAEH